MKTINIESFRFFLHILDVKYANTFNSKKTWRFYSILHQNIKCLSQNHMKKTTTVFRVEIQGAHEYRA